MPQDDDKKSKPTKTVDKPSEFDWLDDLGIPGANDKSVPATAKTADLSANNDENPKDDSQATLPKASAEKTKERTRNIGPDLRGLMNRLSDIEVDPEDMIAPVDEFEPELDRTVPVRVENLPAVLNTEIAPQDEQWPEWHKVGNLPGMMSPQVRAIGRRTMAKFTNTPHEDIATIAYILPPGEDFDPNDPTPRPNTPSEIEKVRNVLADDGEFLGNLDVESPPIPGYSTNVSQYRMHGIRFQLVVDRIDGQRIGMYIYAWPEQDSKSQRTQDSDQLPSPPNARRIQESQDILISWRSLTPQSKFKELISINDYPTLTTLLNMEKERFPLFRNQDIINLINNKLSEISAEVKRRDDNLRAKNPGLEESIMKSKSYALNEYANKAMISRLVFEFYLYNQRADKEQLSEVRGVEARKLRREKTNASLTRLIGGVPGGKKLIRLLHKKHKLSDTAVYHDHNMDERIMWKLFKDHPDNFQIVVGTNGVAGIKPFEGDIKRGKEKAAKQKKTYDPANDNTLRYQIVAFRGQEMVNPDLLRQPTQPGEEPEERDVDPTVMRARGGVPSKRDIRAPNIFDLLREQIGQLKKIAITKSAVEREKIAGRQALKKEIEYDKSESDSYTSQVTQKLLTTGILKKLLNNLYSEMYQDRNSPGLADEMVAKMAQSMVRLKELLKAVERNDSATISSVVKKIAGKITGNPYSELTIEKLFLLSQGKGAKNIEVWKEFFEAARDLAREQKI